MTASSANDHVTAANDSPLLSTDGEQLLAGKLDADEYLSRRRVAAEKVARREVRAATTVLGRRVRTAVTYFLFLFGLAYGAVALLSFIVGDLGLGGVASATAVALVLSAVAIAVWPRSTRKWH